MILAIPDILGGKRILVGDELVPFFNPTSQLLDQARGEYSQLTNGYEFRVRYSFLSTWLRHYQVLPFAVLLVIPSIVWSAYLTTSWFMARVFRSLSTHAVYLGTVFPTGLIYMIMVYAKVTHFYTLVLGLMLMSVSAFVMLDALLFRHDRWARRMVLSCLVTLLNPAVHYLILFALFLSLTTATLLLGELARWIRRGGPGRLVRVVRRPQESPRVGAIAREWWSSRLPRFLNTTTGRCAVAMMLLVSVAIVPYGLFVKFIALRGIPNLSETVPGDYYFIRDASVSLVHVLSWDLAGIMDKIQFGDYLAKVPRVLEHRVHGSDLHPDRRARCPWIPVPEPTSPPTSRCRLFQHRVRHLGHGRLRRTDLASHLPSIAVGGHQGVVRHRITGRRPCADGQQHHRPGSSLPPPFPIDPVHAGTPSHGATAGMGRRSPSRFVSEARGGTATTGQRVRPSVCRSAVVLGSVFFVPFLSNAPYRSVYGSGDFDGFFSAYPVVELKELKNALQDLPPGKTVVLPPTETAKLVIGPDGVPHKFIDKFYIYYSGRTQLLLRTHR